MIVEVETLENEIIKVEFVSFIDCPDCTDLIGAEEMDKIFMGIS